MKLGALGVLPFVLIASAFAQQTVSDNPFKEQPKTEGWCSVPLVKAKPSIAPKMPIMHANERIAKRIQVPPPAPECEDRVQGAAQKDGKQPKNQTKP